MGALGMGLGTTFGPETVSFLDAALARIQGGEPLDPYAFPPVSTGAFRFNPRTGGMSVSPTSATRTALERGEVLPERVMRAQKRNYQDFNLSKHGRSDYGYFGRGASFSTDPQQLKQYDKSSSLFHDTTADYHKDMAYNTRLAGAKVGRPLDLRGGMLDKDAVKIAAELARKQLYLRDLELRRIRGEVRPIDRAAELKANRQDFKRARSGFFRRIQSYRGGDYDWAQENFEGLLNANRMVASNQRPRKFDKLESTGFGYPPAKQKGNVRDTTNLLKHAGYDAVLAPSESQKPSSTFYEALLMAPKAQLVDAFKPNVWNLHKGLAVAPRTRSNTKVSSGKRGGV